MELISERLNIAICAPSFRGSRIRRSLSSARST